MPTFDLKNQYFLLGVTIYVCVLVIVMLYTHYSTLEFRPDVRQSALWSTATILIVVPPPVLYFLIGKIAENHRLLAEVRVLAETDPLTRLLNRAGFETVIHREIESAKATQRVLGLILFDLDDFKGVNDRHGHSVGDAVLLRVARRLQQLPGILSAARMGGDEFAALIDGDRWSDATSPADIQADIQMGMKRLYRSVRTKSLLINVSGSAGLSRLGIDSFDLGELQRNASASLQKAKRSGRGLAVIYNSEIDAVLKRRRVIEAEILSGDYANQLSIAIQPIVDVASGRVISVEALARWRHETLGALNPEEFLSIIRDSGLGAATDKLLRSKALRRIAPFLRSGDLPSVSFNCSPIDLAEKNFADDIIQQISRFQISPRQVWIEITEDEQLTKTALARENIKKMHAAGIRLALDDYGIGYSNIQRLAELPIERIKIDKSIVSKIRTDKRFTGVLESSLLLAKALGAELVLEGVETDAQRSTIESLGCTLMQGFLFSKPVPASELDHLLMQRFKNVA